MGRRYCARQHKGLSLSLPPSTPPPKKKNTCVVPDEGLFTAQCFINTMKEARLLDNTDHTLPFGSAA